MPPGPDLLVRIDRAIAELQAIRAAVAGAEGNIGTIVPVSSGLDVDDLAEANLLDTFSAQQRFGHPADSIRKWCREEGLGVRRGGRWLVSIPRLQARINGKC